MKEWIAVGLGGMLGAMTRHGISQLYSVLGSNWQQWATLSANTIGCCAIGALYAYNQHAENHSHWLSVAARVGLLGGLTTFSSFALDLVRIWQQGRQLESVWLAGCHLTLGLLSIMFAMRLTEHFLLSSGK